MTVMRWQVMANRAARTVVSESLTGSRLEMTVTLTATTAFQQDHFLSVVRHIAKVYG